MLAVLAAPFIFFHPHHLCSYFHQEIRFFFPVQEKIWAVFVIHPVEISVPAAVAPFVFFLVDFPALVAVFVALWVFGDLFYWVLHFYHLLRELCRIPSCLCPAFRKNGNSSVSFLPFDNLGPTFFLPFFSPHLLESLPVEGFPVFGSAYCAEWLISVWGGFISFISFCFVVPPPVIAEVLGLSSL